MRSVEQSLLNRGVDSKYQVHICETQQVATFMLYSPSSHALRGYHQYRPFTLEKRNNDPKNSRYFTYQPRVMQHGDPCVFGLEYCNDIDLSPLFVTEGLFETVKLLNLGFNSVAILSSNASKILLKELKALSPEIVWCGDDDEAGNRSNVNRIASHRLKFVQDIDEIPDSVVLQKIKTLTGYFP